jgi:hypothetical protein
MGEGAWYICWAPEGAVCQTRDMPPLCCLTTCAAPSIRVFCWLGTDCCVYCPLVLALLQGAIQTMCTLAKNPQKRGAAVTMLGKTVELAGHMVSGWGGWQLVGIAAASDFCVGVSQTLRWAANKLPAALAVACPPVFLPARPPACRSRRRCRRGLRI